MRSCDSFPSHRLERVVAVPVVVDVHERGFVSCSRIEEHSEGFSSNLQAAGRPATGATCTFYNKLLPAPVVTVHKVCSTWPAFVFEARPVIPVEDAVRVELETIAWRDGLKRK